MLSTSMTNLASFFFSKCTSQDQYNASMLKKGLKFLGNRTAKKTT